LGVSLLAYLIDRAHHALVCRRRSRVLARRISGLPSSPPRPDANQQLLLRGRLEPLELLLAPLSGSRVAGYRVLVEIPATSWINRRVVVDYSRMAASVFRPEGGEPLAVAGGAVDLLVEAACLEGRRRAGSVDDPQGFPDPLVTVLADRAQIRAEATDPHRYRWAEYHLHGQEELQIAGRVSRQTSDQPVAASQPELVIEAPSPDERLLVTTVERQRLLEALEDPDHDWLRALPGRSRSDRSE
jgi:hypothetical protein